MKKVVKINKKEVTRVTLVNESFVEDYEFREEGNSKFLGIVFDKWEKGWHHNRGWYRTITDDVLNAHNSSFIVRDGVLINKSHIIIETSSGSQNTIYFPETNMLDKYVMDNFPNVKYDWLDINRK